MTDRRQIGQRIFVVGVPRSGTTLLQSLLAGHSALTSFTESHFFDRHYSHRDQADWDLPERWLDARQGIDLGAPVNFVSTADIIGGNSGSPTVNADLEVVGLIFDGNIESLPGDYIYLDSVARSVSVDVRGIVEALHAVYGADRLVQELGVAAPAGR